MKGTRRARRQPKAGMEELTRRLQEAEEALRAIREGEVDAIVVSGTRGEQIFSISGSDAVYRLIIQTMSEAAFTVTLDGTILHSNGQLSRMLGKPLELLIGRPLADFVAAEDRDNLSRLLANAERSPVKARIVFAAARGPVPAHFSASFLGLADNPCICIVASDLSELEASLGMVERLERQQELLKASMERFEVLSETASRLLQSHAPQSIVRSLCARVMEILDCQVCLNFLSVANSERLRLNASLGITKSQADGIREIAYGQAICGIVARDGAPIVAENIDSGADPRAELARSFRLKAYCCHPLIARGKVIGTLSFGTRTRGTFSQDDVALMKTMTDQVSIAMERIGAEKALRQAKAELEKRVKERTAELTRSVSEMRLEAATRTRAEEKLRETNEELERLAFLLRRLVGELGLAEQRERRRLAQVLHDDLQQLLVGARYQVEIVKLKAGEEAREEVARAEELLAQSLEVSRSFTSELNPPALSEGSLISALGWLVRWMSQTHGLSVRLKVAEDTPPAANDITVLLFQAVRELLLNVVKHAGVKSAGLEVSFSSGELRILVSDRGSGFDPTHLDKKAVAGGFGLFNIRERLSLLGGKMEIRSAPGKGSVFSLSVPLDGSRESSAGNPERRPDAEKKGEPSPAEGAPVIRVLITDDHRIARRGLAELLSQEPGIEVVGEADSGEAALDLAGKLRPDVVLMDMQMPGMGGIEATRALRASRPEICVIALSMYDEREFADVMREAGASGSVSKGGSPRALADAIRACRAQP